MSQYDEKLAALLADSVSDVEPDDALETLRARTKVSSMHDRRPWFLAAGGAVLATAAVVTAIAFASGSLTGSSPDPDPTHGPVTQEPSEPASPDDPTSIDEPRTASPVYFAGDTPDGVRLYREFQSQEATSDPLLYSANAAVQGTPLDADYRVLWPAPSAVIDATWDGDIARIDLSGVPLDRPAGMTEEEARIAVQAVVYSAQAAIGEGRVPVQLLVDGQPSATVLGQPTSESLSNDPVLQTLARVSLTTPSEGQVVTGDTLDVSGVANSNEANIVVRVQRWEGTEVMNEDPFTATGWLDDKLFPFWGSIDISAYPPGDYVITARTDDPSGLGMSHTDSKRFTVK